MEKILSAEELVIGCNYHTTWQSDSRMRFVLISVNGTKAKLSTRRTQKTFETNVSDLIFIKSDYNKNKAKEILKHQTNLLKT